MTWHGVTWAVAVVLVTSSVMAKIDQDDVGTVEALLSSRPWVTNPLGGSLSKPIPSLQLWPSLMPFSWKLELLQRLSEMEKRTSKVNSFVGTRGKKNPKGFVGMRGKKGIDTDTDVDIDYALDEIDRAKKPSLGQFLGMRGKKAPNGFVGMRGKKSSDEQPGSSNEDLSTSLEQS